MEYSDAVQAEKRRERTNEILREKGIAVNEYLPVIERTAGRRSCDEICRRAAASLLAIQVACDKANGKYGAEEKAFYADLFQRFEAKDHLNFKERMVAFSENYIQQDIKDVVWEYESCWSLMWALGLVEDITDASGCCDCMTAIRLVSSCENYREFYEKCRLRPWNEILDMLDLYYRYHWACVHRWVDPETETGDLDPDVVWERRRGLEWLFSEQNDWFGISLDT